MRKRGGGGRRGKRRKKERRDKEGIKGEGRVSGGEGGR